MLKVQLKAARALLGYSQDAFAEVSGVSAPTIKRIEAGSGELHASPDVIGKIRRTLDQHGIEIQRDDAEGVIGVRLKMSDLSIEGRQVLFKIKQGIAELSASLELIPKDRRDEELEYALRVLQAKRY